MGVDRRHHLRLEWGHRHGILPVDDRVSVGGRVQSIIVVRFLIVLPDRCRRTSRGHLESEGPSTLRTTLATMSAWPDSRDGHLALDLPSFALVASSLHCFGQPKNHA